MVPRTLRRASVVLAPWLLLAGNVLSRPTTTTAISLTPPTPAPANSAPAPVSTLELRSADHGNGAGLSDSVKVGVSVGVTFAAILIVGTVAIFCVKRGRSRALARPQTVTDGPDDMDDENGMGRAVDENPGKGKETYYMNATSPTHEGAVVSPQAANPDGFMFHSAGYPTMPEQIYSPQQQDHAITYHAPYSADSYAYTGTGYPGYQGTTVVDPSQQSGHAGPSNTHYPLDAHLQPQQQQQQQQQQQYQQGGHTSWTYSLSATSPSSEEPGPPQDVQYQYLQDHHQYQQTHSPSPDANHHHHQDQHQGAELSSRHEHGYYREDAYSPVPPPHPHASELPDQRPPVELMGEGHYSEVP
ncbi:hypothetical protein F5X97DRAFT_97650 [Nemania serpens]|nr:hypothetical protein F5X97DRAFT_97650 [Nemania serpens]